MKHVNMSKLAPDGDEITVVCALLGLLAARTSSYPDQPNAARRQSAQQQSQGRVATTPKPVTASSVSNRNFFELDI